MIKQKNHYLVIAILVLVICLSGCANNSVPAPVNSSNPIVQADKTIEIYGVINAQEYINVFLSFDCKISDVHVNNGQRVSKGDPLVTLDMSEINNLINKEKFQVKSLENELFRISSDIERLRAYKELAENNVLIAEDKYMAIKSLYDMGAVSKQNFIDVEKEYHNALISAQDAAANYKASESLLEQINMNLAIENAQVKYLEEELGKSIFLKGNQIVCPYEEGVVTEIQMVRGDYLNSMQKLMKIIDANSVIVKAEVPEEFIKDVFLGSSVVIKPLADSRKEYLGEVSYVSAIAQRINVEAVVPIEVSILETDQFLLPNLNVDISIKVPEIIE